MVPKIKPQFPVRYFVALIFFIAFFFGAYNAFPQPAPNQWRTLAGTDEGLAGIDRDGRVTRLWSGGAVKKIICVNTDRGRQWFILSSEGILASSDLLNWEHRDSGLPLTTIKIFENGETSFISVMQEIKDFEVDPQNPQTMVCAVKDAVYLTKNSGRNWENLRMPNYRSNGTKAVAVTTLGHDLVVFYTHSIYGFYYIMPGRTNAKWEELNTGLEFLETTENPDEISDIAIRINGSNEPEIIVSQSFKRRIYRLDWEMKRFDPLWSGRAGFGGIDSLAVNGDSLIFIQDRSVLEFRIPEHGMAQELTVKQRRDLAGLAAVLPGNLVPNCVLHQTEAGPVAGGYIGLNELWLLRQTGTGNTAPGNREGIYLPVNHAMDPYSLAPYLQTIKSRNLNMVTIDMKDDYGRLRFTPRNAAAAGPGRVFRPVDLEVFLKTMKDAGIYTVARIVVFKDPEAAAKEGGRYAVWDRTANAPWEGYYDSRQRRGTGSNSSGLKTEILPADNPDYEILRTYYDERWVDPYAEEYWEYIAAISAELADRGFDEIQYDYIRFPTDGINLDNALYRWRAGDMDMDGAIISFLRHVRSRVTVPVSVDIYGANGWYRTGARTGQEVEILSHWVDIICPMYYPSHFEQNFLAHDPPEQRPYRIYYEGTLRAMYYARGRTIIRPWVQAFYLNVSYDRRYYNTGYVQGEIDGTRAAGTGGFTYWNNLGRYDDIPLP